MGKVLKEALTSEKGRTICLLVVVVALIMPVFVLAFYNYPAFDDFAYSIATKNVVDEGGGPLAVLDAAVRTSGYYYDNWQGLYVSAFLLALQPDIYGCYWLTTFVVVAVVFGGIAFFFASMQRVFFEGRGLQWLNVAALVVLFFVMALPSIREGLYWFNGAMNYLPFVSLSLVLYGLLARASLARSVWRKAILIAVATVVSFLVSGGNHVSAFGNILVLAALLALNLRKRWAFFLPTLCSALVGFAISVLSPGTAVRQAALNAAAGEHMGFVETLRQCFWHAFDVLAQWTTPGLLLLLVAITPFLIACRPAQFSFKKRYMAAMLIAPFVTLWMLYCPILYAAHYYGEGRSDDCIFLVFTIETMIVYAYGLYGVLSLGGSYERLSAKRLGIKGFLVLLGAVCLFALPLYGHRSTSHQILNELVSGTPQAFASAQHERRGAIAQSDVGDKVLLTQIPGSPSLSGSFSPEQEVSQYNFTYLPSHWLDSDESYFNREFYAEELEESSNEQ